jgi:CRP-like cAMP-binding protein
MTGKRSIKDLERQCKKEPDNLVVRLLLAAAYREVGRINDAVPLYRSVAETYQKQGRRTQAVAVVKSLLEIDPQDPGSRALLDQMDRDGNVPSTPPPFSPQALPGAPPGAGGPQFGPPGAMTTPVPAPLPSPDVDRPPTIPSLDPNRIRKSSPYPESSKSGSMRVLSEDVVVRELTPVRPPGVPATVRPATPPPPRPAATPKPVPAKPVGPVGPVPKGSPLTTTLSGLGSAGPASRTPTPGKSSSGLFTPTPLPTPVPFHEGDDREDDAATRISDGIRPVRGAQPPLRPVTADPDLGEPTDPRGTGKRTPARSGRATTDRTAPDLDLAAELETRPVRRLSEAELEAASHPPPGRTGKVDRVDSADLDGETDPEASPSGRNRLTPTPTTRVKRAPPVGGFSEDEPTRLADDSKRARMPLPRRPGPRLVPVTPDDPTQRPTARRHARPATPAPLPRPTPMPGELDEPTRVAGAHEDAGHIRDTARMSSNLGDYLTPAPGSGPIEEQTDVRDEPPMRVSEPGMHRSKTFTGTFASTLDEMDPDGAAIDAPLDVFSMLPPEALAVLGRRMTLRHYAPGEIVIREGDSGDACYVIADGEVRVLKNDPLTPDAGPVEVARLGNRALFGEFALLADRRRHATVQATQHCDVYEIPRALLRELAASFTAVGPLLDQFYRQRLLATLLRTAPFFAPLPDEQRAQLLARFVPIRAESGEPIVREGQPAGGLYLIVIGAVEITRRVGKQRSVILATLREGAYFGEMSLLSGEPTTATVIAAGPVELALLPPRDFYEIVATHPQLWSSIRREAKTRALENARLLAGETGTV